MFFRTPPHVGALVGAFGFPSDTDVKIMSDADSRRLQGSGSGAGDVAEAIASARADVARGLKLLLRGVSGLDLIRARLGDAAVAEERGRIAEALAAVDAALAETIRR